MTVCLLKQLSINRRTLSTEAAEFLRVHNEKRRIVSPKATNMREMVRSNTFIDHLCRYKSELRPVVVKTCMVGTLPLLG